MRRDKIHFAPFGFTAGDAISTPEAGTRPESHRGPGWTIDDLRRQLTATPTGRAALAFYLQHQDVIRVWRADHIRCPWKKSRDAEWGSYSCYGTTEGPGTYLVGVIDVTIAADLNGDPLTAAATFVHEMEHARGWVTGEGGYETDARIQDMRFYVEHDALGALPREYFDKGIVYRTEAGYQIDEEALREHSIRWATARPEEEYGERQFGEYWRIPAEQLAVTG